MTARTLPHITFAVVQNGNRPPAPKQAAYKIHGPERIKDPNLVAVCPLTTYGTHWNLQSARVWLLVERVMVATPSGQSRINHTWPSIATARDALLLSVLTRSGWLRDMAYSQFTCHRQNTTSQRVEPLRGIEPLPSGYKTDALPLHHSGIMEPTNRFERSTYSLGGNCSILLSYVGSLVAPRGF